MRLQQHGPHRPHVGPILKQRRHYKAALLCVASAAPSALRSARDQRGCYRGRDAEYRYAEVHMARRGYGWELPSPKDEFGCRYALAVTMRYVAVPVGNEQRVIAACVGAQVSWLLEVEGKCA